MSRGLARDDRAVPRGLRWARGVPLGLVAVLLSYGGHRLAGGLAADGLVLLPPALVAVTGCVVLSGRRLSLPRLLVAMLASQVLFHLWLDDRAAPPPAMHGMHGMPAAPTHGSPWMLLAHGAAALAIALLLGAGERGLWDLLALLGHRRWTTVLALPASSHRPAGVPVAASHRPSVTTLLLATAQPRRGPPWVSA